MSGGLLQSQSHNYIGPNIFILPIAVYLIHRYKFSSDFDLAVWKSFVSPLNLNNAIQIHNYYVY